MIIDANNPLNKLVKSLKGKDIRKKVILLVCPTSTKNLYTMKLIYPIII